MDRLEFLEKARQLANEQIEGSSCESDIDWKEHSKSIDERGLEIVLYEKAKEILEDAIYDINNAINEIDE